MIINSSHISACTIRISIFQVILIILRIGISIWVSCIYTRRRRLQTIITILTIYKQRIFSNISIFIFKFNYRVFCIIVFCITAYITICYIHLTIQSPRLIIRIHFLICTFSSIKFDNIIRQISICKSITSC